MKKAISYLFIFVGIQLLGGAVINPLWSFIADTSSMSAEKLIITTTIISVIVIAVFLLTRWAQVSPTWLRTRPWSVLIWSVVAALGTIIPSTWVPTG